MSRQRSLRGRANHRAVCHPFIHPFYSLVCPIVAPFTSTLSQTTTNPCWPEENVLHAFSACLYRCSSCWCGGCCLSGPGINYAMWTGTARTFCVKKMNTLTFFSYQAGSVSFWSRVIFITLSEPNVLLSFYQGGYLYFAGKNCPDQYQCYEAWRNKRHNQLFLVCPSSILMSDMFRWSEFLNILITLQITFHMVVVSLKEMNGSCESFYRRKFIPHISKQSCDDSNYNRNILWLISRVIDPSMCCSLVVTFCLSAYIWAAPA